MANIAYYNGEFSTLEELKIPALDRSVYFGDGVYDFALVKNNHFFALREHLDRFYRSCAGVDINPMPREEFTKVLNEMLAKIGDVDEGSLYFQASRGTAKRSHTYADGMQANIFAYITINPFPDIKKPLKLITTEDRRYSLCNIKTINLILNVLAAQEAERAHCNEAVFVRDGIVTECAHSNVSIIKDGKFITHPLDCHILPGISRMHTIELCHKLEIEVVEREYTVDELRNADEILVTSTTKLCSCATELDGAKVGGRAPELVEKIQDAFLEKLDNETK